MDKSKMAIVEKFRGKVLGIVNYAHHELNADELTNLETLKTFLSEVENYESDITPAGKVFLEEYYGFEFIADELSKTWTYTKEHILNWLQNLESMEVMTFVETARGNIKGKEKLKEELLPPKDI